MSSGIGRLSTIAGASLLIASVVFIVALISGPDGSEPSRSAPLQAGAGQAERPSNCEELTRRFQEKPMRLIETFKASRDPLELDDITSAARNSCDRSLIAGFAREAVENPDELHRTHAVGVITSFDDRDGSIRDALRKIIQEDCDENVRLAAMGGLSEFLSQGSNRGYYREFLRLILAILNSAESTKMKTQALAALPPSLLSASDVREIATVSGTESDASVLAEEARLFLRVTADASPAAEDALRRIIESTSNESLKRQASASLEKLCSKVKEN